MPRLPMAALSLLCVLLPPGDGRAAERLAIAGSLDLYGALAARPPEWRRVRARIALEQPAYAACARDEPSCPSAAADAWQHLLAGLGREPAMAQLQAVNRFVNRRPYRADIDTFARSDHWASPLEFLRGAGDCEDFAILKYVSLRQLGFTPDRLDLRVVLDVERRLVHAILAVEVDGQTYLLDNLHDELTVDSQMSSYLTLYFVDMKEERPEVALATAAFPPVATQARSLHPPSSQVAIDPSLGKNEPTRSNSKSKSH